MNIHNMDDGRVIAACGDVLVEIPKEIEGRIDQLMAACHRAGAAEAREKIRTALGVDTAIEAESQSIYANLQPEY